MASDSEIEEAAIPVVMSKRSQYTGFVMSCHCGDGDIGGYDSDYEEVDDLTLACVAEAVEQNHDSQQENGKTQYMLYNKRHFTVRRLVTYHHPRDLKPLQHR